MCIRVLPTKSFQNISLFSPVLIWTHKKKKWRARFAFLTKRGRVVYETIKGVICFKLPGWPHELALSWCRYLSFAHHFKKFILLFFFLQNLAAALSLEFTKKILYLLRHMTLERNSSESRWLLTFFEWLAGRPYDKMTRVIRCRLGKHQQQKKIACIAVGWHWWWRLLSETIRGDAQWAKAYKQRVSMASI